MSSGPDAVTATFGADMLAGRVALVVGGSSGIGAAIAGGLASAGAVVTVTGATAAEVRTALAQPGFAPRDAIVVDVRNAGAVRAPIADLPRLDVLVVLVHCAGVIRRDAEHDVDVFEEVLAVNLTGTMRCCTLARDKLRVGGSGQRLDRQYCIGAGVPRGRAGAWIQREQGRRRAADQVARARVCGGRDSRQCHCARMGADAADAGAAG